MTRVLENPRPNAPATAALLTGLASVVPGVGLVAMVLGIMGMSRSRELNGAGRGRAFAGVVLGIGSLMLWAMLAGAYFQGRALMRAAPAVEKTPGFIRDLSTGNVNGAKSVCTDAIDIDRLATTAEQVQGFGVPTGKPTPLGGEPIGQTGVRVEYELPFEKGSKIVQVDWTFQNGDPKQPRVSDYRLIDPPATQPGK